MGRPHPTIPGLEVSNFGFITRVDGRLTKAGLDDLSYKRHGGFRREHLAGYATRWNKVHLAKDGTVEVFSPGAFADSLLRKDSVRLLVGHDEGAVVATTRTGGLVLHADAKGLAFMVPVPDSVAGREARSLAATNKASMSIGYHVVRDDWRVFDGTRVRLLRECALFEISLLPPGRGAVKEAFAVLLTDETKSLERLCSSGALAAHGGALLFRRALAGVAEAFK